MYLYLSANCSKPDPPTNGEVLLANETTAQIVCNKGYSSQMNLMLVCIHSNQWNPDPTTLNCVKSEIGNINVTSDCIFF